jgi:hypothetical protein
MTASIREQILQHLLGLFTPIATTHHAQILRSPTTGISREHSPALLMFPEADTIAQRANDRVERLLTIRLVALARETGVRPEAQADTLLVAAHAALFADPNIGGLALGIHELDCDWDVEDADAVAAAVPARYQIRYRIFVHDIAQQG